MDALGMRCPEFLKCALNLKPFSNHTATKEISREKFTASIYGQRLIKEIVRQLLRKFNRQSNLKVCIWGKSPVD